MLLNCFLKKANIGNVRFAMTAVMILAAVLIFCGCSGQNQETASQTLPEAASVQTLPICEPDPLPDPNVWKNNILMECTVDTVIPFGGYRSSIEGESVFGAPIYRNEIASVTFENTLNHVGSGSWDVSASGDGSVVAWVESTSDGFYDLYIAAEGGINGREACRDLFCGYANLKTIRFNGSFFTEEAEDMSRMFYGCRSLQTMDLSGIRTDKAVSTCELFANCRELKMLDLSGFDTSKVTDMGAMFCGCKNLWSLDVACLETGLVTDVSYMFQGCPAAGHQDWSNFNISNVKNYGLFMDDGALIHDRPWEDFFADKVSQEEDEVLMQVLTDHWDSGSVKITIFSESHARIELTDSILEEPDFRTGKNRIMLYLSHSVEDMNGYELCIRYRDGEISCYGSYLMAGSAANSYHPKDVTCSYRSGTVTVDLYASDIIRWTLWKLEDIQILLSNTVDYIGVEMSRMDPRDFA